MAKNDGKIYITISDKRFGRNKAEADEQNKSDKEKEENVIGKYIAHRFFNMLEAQAKQAVNYTISNIGNFTGDYASQTHIEDSLVTTRAVLGLAMSAYVGAKTGGLIGAALGFGIGVATQAIALNQELYAGKVQNARQNEAIAVLRTRAGLNGTNNGSRGTDY